MGKIINFSTTPSNLEVLKKVIDIIDAHNLSVDDINYLRSNKLDKDSTNFESISIGSVTLTETDNKLKADGKTILNEESVATYALRDAEGAVISTTYALKDGSDFVNKFLGKSDIAEKALADNEGFIISNTYLKIEDFATQLESNIGTLLNSYIKYPTTGTDLNLAADNLFINDKRVLTEDDAIGEVDFSNYLTKDGTAAKALADGEGTIISEKFAEIDSSITALNEASLDNQGVSTELFQETVANLMPRVSVSNLEDLPTNCLLSVDSSGSIFNSVANIGNTTQPIFISAGKALPITANVRLGYLPAISNGNFSESSANIGASNQAIYLENGQFKPCTELTGGDSSGSSTVTQTLLQRYGIVGDGVTDCSDGLQELIYDTKVDGTIELTEGEYLISKTILIESPIKIRGSSAILRQTERAISSINTTAACEFENITFSLTAKSLETSRNTDIAISTSGIGNLIVNNCNFDNFSIAVESTTSGELSFEHCKLSRYCKGFSLSNFNKCRINSCQVENPTRDWYTANAASVEYPRQYDGSEGIYDKPLFASVISGQNLQIINCFDKGNTFGPSIQVSNVTNLVIANNIATGLSDGFYFSECSNISVYNNSIDSMVIRSANGAEIAKQYAIHLSNCQNFTVQDNVIDTGEASVTCIAVDPDTITIGETHSDATVSEGIYTGYYITPTGAIQNVGEEATITTPVSYTTTKNGTITITWSATVTLTDESTKTFTSAYSIQSLKTVDNVITELLPTRNIKIISNSFSSNLQKPLVDAIGSSSIIIRNNTVTPKSNYDSSTYGYRLRGCFDCVFEDPQYIGANASINLLKLGTLESNLAIPCADIKVIADNLPYIVTNDLDSCLNTEYSTYATKAEVTSATSLEAFSANLINSIFSSMRFCQYIGSSTITQESSVDGNYLKIVNILTPNRDPIAPYDELYSGSTITMMQSTEAISEHSIWKLVSANSLSSMGIALFVKISDAPIESSESSGEDTGA